MTHKILAIGNAIIDITCKVDDAFLTKNKLVKGSMSLIDEQTAQKLSALPSEKITSGGSAGNTIATIAELGTQSAFIGKVATDALGKKFISELAKSGTKFLNTNFSNEHSAKSFVLITPDAQRTMCTFLGCAPEINEDDIQEAYFKDVSILYLEGYLWDGDATIAALKKAITLAKKHKVKVAFSLSDSFCVSRHKSDFLSLIKDDLDLLFANEAEIMELTSSDEFSLEALQAFFLKNEHLVAAITRSEKGCIIFQKNTFFKSAAKEAKNLMDSTGAGDAFAAGFLHGFLQDIALKKTADFGNILASHVIQKIGARLSKEEIEGITLK